MDTNDADSDTNLLLVDYGDEKIDDLRSKISF